MSSTEGKSTQDEERLARRREQDRRRYWRNVERERARKAAYSAKRYAEHPEYQREASRKWHAKRAAQLRAATAEAEGI